MKWQAAINAYSVASAFIYVSGTVQVQAVTTVY